MARILVVDDDLFYRNLVAGFVRNMGHDAIMAVKGDDALGAVRARAFDLLVMDVFMEGKDGITVVEELADQASRAGGSRIPAIIMTSDDSIGTEVRARQAQVQAFLLKPFAEETLRQAVVQILGAGT